MARSTAARCGCSGTSRASTTAATAISPRGRTSSTTGSSWSRRARHPRRPGDGRDARDPDQSGNCIRNISSDQFAGAAKDEVADPRPWAELLRQWSDLPPRIQLSAAQVQDRGDRQRTRIARRCGCTTSASSWSRATACLARGVRRRRHGTHSDDRARDQGLRDRRRPAELCRGVPARLQSLRPARQHLQGADQDPGARDRRRRISPPGRGGVRRGEGAGHSTRPPPSFERITAMFAPPAFDADAADDAVDRSDPDFAVWLDQNVEAHKASGYAIVNISLKPVGGIPGDASAEQIDVMADLAERYSFDELRVTHAQNIVLPHVRIADLKTVWQRWSRPGSRRRTSTSISDIIACPGLDYCSLANARSIPIAQKIAAALRRTGAAARSGRAQAQDQRLHQRLRPPPCRAHRHSGRRQEGRGELPAARSAGRVRRMSASARSPAPDSPRTASSMRSSASPTSTSRCAPPGERFLDTYRRVGMEPFKEAIYG